MSKIKVSGFHKNLVDSVERVKNGYKKRLKKRKEEIQVGRR
jgi:acylphosphatase